MSQSFSFREISYLQKNIYIKEKEMQGKGISKGIYIFFLKKLKQQQNLYGHLYPTPSHLWSIKNL